MSCQVFKNPGCSPAQPSVSAAVYWPCLVLCRVAGEDKAFDRVMKYDGVHRSFLISFLFGAKIDLTARDQGNKNRCVPCFCSAVKADYRGRAVRQEWTVGEFGQVQRR